MDINLLVVTVGNSRLSAGAFAAGDLRNVGRSPLADRSQCERILREAWNEISSTDGRAAAAASVNPKLNSLVDELVEQIAGQSVQWVGSDLELPIEVSTQNPQQTGVDRILNVAAAFEQIGKACIVVDAGTAVTVDCCNDNGDFVGGAILPGVDMMIDALARNGGRRQGNIFGPQSRRGRFDRCRRVAGDLLRHPRVGERGRGKLCRRVGPVAGDHRHRRRRTALFDGWELIHAISPDLGLYGVALAYANHHIRHD